MLHIQYFVFNALRENTYVLYDAATRECLVLDPGCYTERERDTLDNFLADKRLLVKHLVNTHAHVDHIAGNQHVKEKYNVELRLHKEDLPMLDAAVSYAPSYCFEDYKPAQADGFLQEGDLIQVGAFELAVLHVPGHSPGHIALYQKEEGICFVGDVLFKDSVGRVDLPGGDADQLSNSIQKRLLTLPDAVKVYPGHGPPTTIGRERKHNPFCVNLAP